MTIQSLLPHIVIWTVLATIVVFLAIYRRRIGAGSDETLHVLDAEAGAIGTQTQVARRLAVIDRWGKVLTALVVVYLLAVAGVYFYSAFQDQSIKLS